MVALDWLIPDGPSVTGYHVTGFRALHFKQANRKLFWWLLMTVSHLGVSVKKK